MRNLNDRFLSILFLSIGIISLCIGSILDKKDMNDQFTELTNRIVQLENLHPKLPESTNQLGN